MRQALTYKQIYEEYNLSRHIINRLVEKGMLKKHKPNLKEYTFLRDELEKAIRAS